MGTSIFAEPIELIEGTLNSEQKTVDVILIKAGWSQNGRYYSRAVLEKAAPLFEGVKAYANHPTREQLKRGESRSVLDITGDYTGIRIGENGEIRGTRHVYGKAGEAVWPLIERSVTTGNAIVGVSINALGKAASGKGPDGKEGEIVESINKANSADDVDNPAAGGEFKSLLMGDNSLISDLLQTITEDELTTARPDLVETMRKQMKRARQDEAMRAITEQLSTANAALKALQTKHDELATTTETARENESRLICQVALEKALREAKFKQPYETLLRERLNKSEPGSWLDIISEERALLRAAEIKPDPVTVHGAPLMESQPVQPLANNDGPVDMDKFNTPDLFAKEMERRRNA